MQLSTRHRHSIRGCYRSPIAGLAEQRTEGKRTNPVGAHERPWWWSFGSCPSVRRDRRNPTWASSDRVRRPEIWKRKCYRIGTP